MFKAKLTVASLLTVMLSAGARPSKAQQTPFSDEQRKAFSDLFQMADPKSRAEGATPQERALLLSAQNARVALPPNLEGYSEYLQKDPLMLLIKKGGTPELGVLLLWNLTALDLTAVDHTLAASPASTGHEQFGPHRTSRVLAITHLAMFEAVNAIYNQFESYKDLQTKFVGEFRAAHPELPAGTVLSPANVSVDTAIIAAGHDTLVALYPLKKAMVDLAVLETLQGLGLGTDPTQLTGKAKLGYALGQAAAKSVLDERGYDPASAALGNSAFTDGSSEKEPVTTDPPFSTDGADRWHPDPIHPLANTALGGKWMDVRPFVITHADAFRPAAEPAKSSKRFIDAYKEVKRLGGDDTPGLQPPRGTTPTVRTAKESEIGEFWAYDGTALLCAPPRLYNEIATTLALKEKPIKHVEDMARFLALLNLAMADAGISAWDAKYAFRLGRPVTYIRNVPVDATPEGAVVAGWTPKGAPVSNGTADARNLTPPFPAFPSGHAVFGGAVFQFFRDYWETNGSGEEFSFMSDEFNGHNYPPGGTTPRPEKTLHFKDFAQAEKENARSRIYLGIHWQFDADVGVEQGHEVANYVFHNALLPK